MNYKAYQYVREHISLYIFTVVLFVMGLIFGSYIISSLSLTQKQEIITSISSFFLDISTDQWLNTQVSFTQVLFENLKYLGLLWFLGLSVIGIPLIFIIIFMKGFVVGFTISFLISELQWKGLVFSLISIIPQNLIIVPVFIIAGVAGTGFSLSLIRSRGKNKMIKFQHSFLSYSSFILILGGILLIASGFETYISPYLIKSVAKFFI